MTSETIDARERAAERDPGAARRIETVIVGGGQAGLATSYHLARRGREHVILDAGARVGDGWRRRWPSLRLYSAARLDGLPGMRFPAPGHTFPSSSEMGDFLEAYAARFGLPVESGVAVDALERRDGRYLVSAGTRRWEADNVVIATGAFRDPRVPSFAADLDPAIRQLHSSAYRGPEQLRDGPVLVVGAAHSGADIAHELAATHPTILSGPSTGELPFRCDGPVARLADAADPAIRRDARADRAHADGPQGAREGPQGRRPAAALPLARAPRRRGRARARAHDRRARRQADARGRPQRRRGERRSGARASATATSGCDCGLAFGDDGFPEQERGAAKGCPGLFFAGLRFQHSFGSMLVAGAGRDGGRVARQIAARSRQRAADTSASPAGVRA